MPFRQLAFRWDAKVCLCCDDFRGELPIVDAMAESITHFADVWWDSVDWIFRHRRTEINGYGMDFCHVDSLDWLHFLQYKPYSNFLQKLSGLIFCGNGKPVYIMKV